MTEQDKAYLKTIPMEWTPTSNLPKTYGKQMRLVRLNHNNLIEIKFETINSLITCLVRLKPSPSPADNPIDGD